MRSCRILFLVAALLAIVSSVSATKYYFNSFDSSSNAGWTGNAANPANSVAGLYKWAGGSYGYEMMAANATDANKGFGFATAATPSATVAQDFWMSADFRSVGGYPVTNASGFKRAFTFFVDATGAGVGVYAGLTRTDGTAEVGVCYSSNFLTLPTGATGVGAISTLAVDTTFDNTNFNDVRVAANFRDSAGMVDLYLNGNLLKTVDLLGVATPPSAATVRNFTKVGTWFYNDFNEAQFANVAVDNIWCGSVANPYQNAQLLAGDVNGDLTVDVVDLGLLATNWKKGNATWNGALDSALIPGNKIMGWNAADFNGDKTVDVVDLGLLATNWKKSIAAPVQPTPEPASMALLAIAGLGVLARRRK